MKRRELALVAVVALVVLLPGIWSYTLVDPWETHYGEVARNMIADHDLVHMQWPGTNAENSPNEGFRSKPVLMFWMEAAAMKAVGLDKRYSGEMAHDARTLVAIRLPFVLAALLGLMTMWWMLARLVSRRLAWLALLVVGSCPFFCLVARQGIPDMALTATVMGAIAMFVLALEAEGEASRSARYAVLGVCGAFMAIQAIYAVVYFITSPQLAVTRFPSPPVFFVVLIGLLFGALSRTGWMVFRWYAVIIGSALAFAFSRRSRLTKRALDEWDDFAPDRFLLRLVARPFVRTWRATRGVSDHVLAMAPLSTARQVNLMWCYAFLGVSILAKGPPGIAVVGFVGLAYVILCNRWRALYAGEFELKRGVLLMTAIFLPWHIAMFLKEGPLFLNEYLFQHLIDRAAVGNVDHSFGTFEQYTAQLGHGMWLWAALIPPALACALVRSSSATREGRVRFVVALWAVCGFAFFGLVQTKFHHYILPIVPALGILVAFYLDDLWARRERLHIVYAVLAIAIVALVTRDLTWEPERWIEMFIYRYDRPWPSAQPYAIDPTKGILLLGALAMLAIIVAAAWRRGGVIALGVAGLAICLWSLHVYMPLAARHWGMGDGLRTYYRDRTIYGEKLVYFGAAELADDWRDVHTSWSFDTFVPDALQVGQPMTLSIVVKKPEDEKITEQELALVGTVSAIGDHTVEVALPPAERAKLDPVIARAGARGRPAIRVVDADRLVAWRLYWRGEQFWSGGEIWGPIPEMKTTFQQDNDVDFKKYLNDRTRAPAGRRYFIVTEAGRLPSVKAYLPTQRAKDSFEVIDTTSNKFSLGVFTM